MTAVTGGRFLKLSSYSLALQLVAVDDLGSRVRQQRVSQMTLEGKCFQDFRAVIREPGHVIAALLDLGDTGVHIDKLGLTIGAPVRRAEEEEDQAVGPHEIG